MKHKHYEMIVAKAANMSLVRMYYGREKGEWEVSPMQDFLFYDNNEYFLCLPQHKEACLHWLNGGKLTNKQGSLSWSRPSDTQWSPDSSFMDENEDIRIPPKKEKRWIAIYGNHVFGGHFKSKELAMDTVNKHPNNECCAPEAWQFIEIEVEV